MKLRWAISSLMITFSSGRVLPGATRHACFQSLAEQLFARSGCHNSLTSVSGCWSSPCRGMAPPPPYFLCCFALLLSLLVVIYCSSMRALSLLSSLCFSALPALICCTPPCCSLHGIVRYSSLYGSNDPFKGATAWRYSFGVVSNNYSMLPV